MATLEKTLAEKHSGAAPFDPARAPDRSGRWGTTIGMKVLTSVTGVVLVIFLVFHLAGNLLAYRRPEAINAYSARLRREPTLLWIARALLVVSVLVHIAGAARLWRRHLYARPVAITGWFRSPPLSLRERCGGAASGSPRSSCFTSCISPQGSFGPRHWMGQTCTEMSSVDSAWAG